MKIADCAERYAHVRGVCASRHGERPDLPWHSSLAAADRGPALAGDHWRDEQARLATGFDVAEACALTFVVPSP